MSVADTTRNEPHVPRDEKGKFTSAQTDADHAPGALAPLGNTEMKNILKHIGTCLCAAFVCHFEARVVKSHAGSRISHTETLESKLNERDSMLSKRDAELDETKKRVQKFTEKTREGMQSALNSLMKK